MREHHESMMAEVKLILEKDFSDRIEIERKHLQQQHEDAVNSLLAQHQMELLRRTDIGDYSLFCF